MKSSASEPGLRLNFWCRNRINFAKSVTKNLPRTCRNRFSDNGVADTSKNITPLAAYFLLIISETKTSE